MVLSIATSEPLKIFTLFCQRVMMPWKQVCVVRHMHVKWRPTAAHRGIALMLSQFHLPRLKEREKKNRVICVGKITARAVDFRNHVSGCGLSIRVVGRGAGHARGLGESSKLILLIEVRTLKAVSPCILKIIVMLLSLAEMCLLCCFVYGSALLQPSFGCGIARQDM